MRTAEALIGEYLSHLRVEKGLAKNTTSAYKRDLYRFLEYLASEEIELENLSTDLMQEFVARLRGKGGGKSVSGKFHLPCCGCYKEFL